MIFNFYVPTPQDLLNALDVDASLSNAFQDTRRSIGLAQGRLLFEVADQRATIHCQNLLLIVDLFLAWHSYAHSLKMAPASMRERHKRFGGCSAAVGLSSKA